jgi:WD40 repeat protein
MASEPPKVLISYSHDSPEHEQRVLELANRLRVDGIDCTIDQYVVAPAEGWPRWMDKHIRDSDFVVMVCTETHYERVMGEEEPGKGLGVRWEGHLIYQAIYNAESINTKFIPVLFESGKYAHIPAPVQSTTFYFAQTEDGYEDLYRRLTNQPRAIKQELGKLRSLPSAERKSEGAVGKLVNVPNLPPNFLPRPRDLQAVKDAVLAGLTKPVTVTGTGKIGVQGMGGIGKTVLAAALAHDSEIQQAFPDGIYWLTVGEKPKLLDLQNQLLRQLTGSRETLSTEKEISNALRDALAGRRPLIVLDDVWRVDHARAFSVTAPPARLLITTRNTEILSGLSGQGHCLGVLSADDALQMLASLVGEQNCDELPHEATDVASECGYLPLALAMIGAMVRLSSRSTAWKEALALLRHPEFRAIKQALPAYPYPDQFRAINVSIEGLGEVDRERYLDLAVFPEDQPIPEEALRVLWNLDEVDTRACIARYIARSLATRSVARGSEALTLHDLQRDLIRKRREEKLPDLHLRLVEAWNALPKLDSYAWRWVPYHLVQAGRRDDLRRLLLDFDYLQAKLSSTDPNALIADYDYLPEDTDLRTVQSILRHSAHILAGSSKELPSQLIGRLPQNLTPDIDHLRSQASDHKSFSWLRPLYPSLTPISASFVRALQGHTSPVDAVAVTPDSRHVISGSRDGTLRVWDLATGETKTTLQGHNDRVNTVAITPDGRYVVSGSDDSTLRVWDLATGETKTTLRGHTGSVLAVAVAPDSRSVVSSSRDGTLRVWDLATGETKTTLQDRGTVDALVVTPDSRHVVSSWGDLLRIWDLTTGETTRILKGHNDTVNALAVTPDGRYVVSGSQDHTLRVWELATGETKTTLQGHTSPVDAVAVTPDSRHVISGSRDGTLRVWDLATGETKTTLQGHTGSVLAVAVTPDDRHVVSGSDDKTLRVWDLATGETKTTRIQLGSGENRGIAFPDQPGIPARS